jgi:long-chain fatty acid transport protein
MPASGGMGGTSVARPQDLLSAMNANPAALSQFRGTQFTLAGAFAGSTFDLNLTGPAPAVGVTPFSAKSQTPGAVIPNIGVSQELTAYGMPMTFGIGLIGTAGAGTSFLQQPASNGTSTYLLILNFAPIVAVTLTDRLSIGTTMFVGDAYLSGPFVGVSSMTNALALCAGLGASYEMTDDTTLGFYWQSKQNFNFKNEVILFNQTLPQNVAPGLPDQIGLGIANTSLMDGRLLLAADALYIQWKTADLFQDIYRNQWVMQLGAQYRVSQRVRLRAGYELAQIPIDPNTGNSVAGIPVPGGIPAVKYL